MQRTVWFQCAALMLFISDFAIANDSIARVGAGGITLLKTENIRMVQEELEISTESIRVRYRFKNESEKDIQATIAFPMPTFGWNPGESMLDANIKPLRPFTTKVDGRSVDVTIAKKAVIGGNDVTNTLRGIGLADEQIFETFSHCPDDGMNSKFELCGLSKDQEDALKKLGEWKVSEIALWGHTFQAKKEVEVTHEYAPFVGASYTYPFQGKSGYVSDVLVKGASAEACVDDGTRKAIQKRVKSFVVAGANAVWVSLDEVEYILGTGRNWKGPIGAFKLRIIKDSPNQVVSLCFPGKPKWLDEKTFEFSQVNYVPQDKLVIYFYTIGSDLDRITFGSK